MQSKLSGWSKAYLIIVFIILYAPILFLVMYSFSKGNTMSNFHGFTFAHYQTLFHDPRLIQIVLDTLIVALLSSLFATIIGTAGALGVYETRHRAVRQTVLSLNNILMVSPDVIIGASFLIFFTMLGLRLGFISVLLSHIAFSIPIVVLLVLPKLNEMNASMIDAAADLGANPWQTLTRVILPAIMPGIFSGFFMAVTYSLDDFAVTFFVTGNGFSTLSVEIYSRARQGVDLEINALSALWFLVSLLLIAGYYFLEQYNQGRKTKNRQQVEAVIK
ncbi:MAG: ABC transporter permease [Furfurilactobacillus sp.]|jgi:spermidine/putrescine transport system permease protein|uniref:ABC transporter permease n=1 Tax=Furfurilactobacillus milii TaxID=2888272 RepID=A0ABT6D8Y0_9LACO|nr:MULTISPECIES: ABC transporter permease [Furfurilactobacillus]QLE67247.1 Spermidine Putrescine ABC transporter permease component potC [Furfurilactobacillus rossiae]MCF6161062.1 ABC transporter permease [Furfurilactobacillus milii]MCF6163448.1 ABC transporter permease [Furfurilactobacillus milii]MCF6418750.1 ABC transporter permease [Furfurilactobacillus milii]MCH4011438.1 ABC transporter permease [Furfurilactobacillus sp.]